VPAFFEPKAVGTIKLSIGRLGLAISHESVKCAVESPSTFTAKKCFNAREYIHAHAEIDDY
jgi:hypothetical protein